MAKLKVIIGPSISSGGDDWVDGGSAASVYLQSQNIDGGNA